MTSVRTRAVFRWLGANAEALIALVMAVIVGILGITGSVSAAVVNSAILATLAALALSVLRNRWDFGAEPDARARLRSAQQSLDELPRHIGRLSQIDEMVTDFRATLDEESAIRILRGNEITQSLTEARVDAREWIFRGGTATFVRAVVLPECIQRARRARRSLNVRLEILDPRSLTLCDRYANFFRHGMSDPNEDEQTWTGEGTQLELYATIFSACWWKQNYPPLRIEVALSSTVTLFRWDMTQNCLFITERGPRFPAMMIREGRFYYDYWRNELDEHFDQSHKVPLGDAPRLSEDPTPAETRELFTRLDLDLPDHVTDDDVKLIIRQAINAQNPYA
ncbi:hypothetical protein G9272_32530 [Streptomyces asoensis]|uniref:Uncharacterized protein n=1 Tax=Streptomyces asoensis TaxID=249586 RepID=A0A6M4WXV1_9ACTN|nr:hypothetical protein [Streptomyces asoensis]QJT04441.1 hypothetical protein G9272_32530 [Streptomyces asoensis]